jgi:hypothetical protein
VSFVTSSEKLIHTVNQQCQKINRMNSLTFFQNINSHIISILNAALSRALADASQMRSVAGRSAGVKQPSAK